MIIVIDRESTHVQFIEISDTYPLVDHPDGVSGKITVLKLLEHYNTHPADREKGGYHIVSQLPGEDRPYSRWERVVIAANHPQAHPGVLALGLKA